MAEKEISDLIKDNKRFHFSIEISQTDNQEKKDKFAKLIKDLDYVPMAIDGKAKKDKMFDELDKEIYAQPWKKLKLHQQETRLELYVREKFKEKEQDQKQYLTDLKYALNEGYLKDTVTYDTQQMKITDISNFTFNEDEDMFMVIKKKVSKPKKAKKQESEESQETPKKVKAKVKIIKGKK